MTYVFAVSLGPVQDFIASARRSRDLWFGSWLLSELSKAAAAEVAAGELSRLVFPSPGRPEDLRPNSPFSAANKIVAVIDENPADVGERVRRAVRGRLLEVTDGAFGNITGDYDREVALAQVIDLPEVVWAAAELKGGDDYARARGSAEALLAARKTTRDFSQASWGKDVPKSSLDGQRESVIPEPSYRALGGDELRRRYGVSEGERLCGVGLLKRHGSRGEGDRFFSTSHVAALPLIDSLKPLHAGDVAEFVKTLKSLGISGADMGRVPGAPHPAFGNYDGHLLFAERLGEYLNGEELLAAGRGALDQLLGAAAGGRRPIPYYALLLADGDRMGKVIDSQRDAAAHRGLSRALADFAAGVRGVVDSHRGSLVYAGGDDVLAFAPLHTVLHCARALSEAFRTSLGNFIDTEGAPPTLSVGIAISHHQDPLSDALTLARSAEKQAKSFPGKNALAVVVSKRSGADRSAVGSWGLPGSDEDALDRRLMRFVDLLLRAAIPSGVAYELSDLARRLGSGLGEAPPPECDQMIRAEAMRVMRRKRGELGAAELTPQVMEAMDSLITTGGGSVAELSAEIIIAGLFADAIRLAGGKGEGQ
jgi:CRISPR-associated protein Cmr2